MKINQICAIKQAKHWREDRGEHAGAVESGGRQLPDAAEQGGGGGAAFRDARSGRGRADERRRWESRREAEVGEQARGGGGGAGEQAAARGEAAPEERQRQARGGWGRDSIWA